MVVIDLKESKDLEEYMGDDKMGREEDYEDREKDSKEMREEFHRILETHKVSEEDQKKLVSLSRHMD